MMIDIFAKKLLTNNLLIIPIVFLIIALYPFHSKFYMLVIIVFIFGIAVFLGLPDNMKREKYTFLVSAIIYNPIFPLYLGTRFIWISINLLVLYFFWKLRKNMK